MGERRSRRTLYLSMRGVMILSMLMLIVVIMAVFLSIIQATQLLQSLDRVSYRSLSNSAADRGAQFSSELNLTARNARQAANAMELRYQALVESADDTERALDTYFAETLDGLVNFLDHNAATGAFVVLESSYTGEEGARAALYLRNPNPGSSSGAGDHTVLFGPTRITSGTGMALEKSWSYELFLENTSDPRFYIEPGEAARLYPKADSRDWGYWSRPMRMGYDDLQVITYTTPLLDARGEVAGVFGVEYSLSYMTQIMPGDNLPFESGFFMVGIVEEGAIARDAVFTASAEGSRLLLDFEGDLPFAPAVEDHEYTVFELENRRGEALYLSAASLGLYGQNSPFLEQGYSLLALAPKGEVLASSNSIFQGLLLAFSISLPTALLAAFFLSRLFASPIEKLAGEVRSTDPEREMLLSPTGIHEIDALAEVLQEMNADIARNAARMSTIVDLVGIPMGAFEVQLREERVFLTDSLFRLLAVERLDDSSHYVSADRFYSLLPGVNWPAREGESGETEICMERDGGEQCLRIQTLRSDTHIYGTVTDTTEEVRRKRWLEYERDYDPLTMLLNRNAYPGRMNELIEAQPDAMGVLLFGDLDNLKYINDTFGHDMGDRYIKLAADALRGFSRYGGVAARVSGDEFVVYLHGLSDRQSLREIVGRTMREVRGTAMLLPDGNEQRVRISVGLAYYPDDATTIEQLIHYADFAMYEIKHSSKGGTREFDPDSYSKNSYILQKPSQLDRLIEGRRLRFAFQPIVDARTGEVFAYEALMRPQTREFHTPLEVLTLAKSQSKLYQIEQLTITALFEWLYKNQSSLGGKRLFINSISNQILTDEDVRNVSRFYPDDHSQVVIEFTESEQGSEELLQHKLAHLRENGFGVAVDDYGAGYSNETSLLEIHPDFIKVDMAIIRGIERDPNRQLVVRKLVDFAGSNHSRVIAEGIETPAELETVIRLGVHYLQGFYLGRPEFEIERQDVEHCRQAAALWRGCFGG